MEFPKIDLKYLKEAFKEPINFWGMAGFAVAAAYVQDVTPLVPGVGMDRQREEELLRSLAEGAPEARLTQEAKAALGRLTSP